MKIDHLFENNKLFYTLFFCSTIFFIYQHSTGLSWDFSAYVLNAKYIFSNGFYFEWNRPPLSSFIIGIFSIFGWMAAEYLYIIFVSIILAYSSKLLADSIKVDKTLFYGMLLSPFVLNTGLSVGTELLYFSFLQLAIAYMFRPGYKSAVFIGLMGLAHYSAFIYTLLLFFKRNLKKILLSFLVIVVFFVPWLLYSFYLTGDSLTSIANTYAMNVKFREYIQMPFNVSDVLEVSSYYIVLFAFGVYKVFNRRITKMDILMVGVLVLSLLSYYTIPIKSSRYLFNLILPLVYFSAVWINKLKLWKSIILMIIIINFSLGSLNFVALDDRRVYESALPKVDSCMIKSNGWVFINYLGKPAEPFPRQEDVAKDIANGTRIILFKGGYQEPNYTFDRDFISSFPIMDEANGYVILGNASKCTPPRKVDRPYISYLNERGYNVTPCNVLLPEQVCSVFKM